MIGTHFTADRKEIPLICMDDNHLLNIIKLRIVKPFDVYNASLNIDKKVAFHLGRQIPSVEKPDVKRLISNSIYYISEALRRDNTRSKMLEILGKLDEDFGNPTQLVFEQSAISNFKLLETTNDDDDWDCDATENDLW